MEREDGCGVVGSVVAVSVDYDDVVGGLPRGENIEEFKKREL